MERFVAATVLALIVVAAALGLGTSLGTIGAVVVLAGLPWSFLAVGMLLSESPPFMGWAVAVAAVCVNLALAVALGRRARRS
jgi:hypothetical protein